ncbi:hypothetical protein L9F63_028093, partial [Diploptera punctata]
HSHREIQSSLISSFRSFECRSFPKQSNQSTDAVVIFGRLKKIIVKEHLRNVKKGEVEKSAENQKNLLFGKRSTFKRAKRREKDSFSRRQNNGHEKFLPQKVDYCEGEQLLLSITVVCRRKKLLLFRIKNTEEPQNQSKKKKSMRTEPSHAIAIKDNPKKKPERPPRPENSNSDSERGQHQSSHSRTMSEGNIFDFDTDKSVLKSQAPVTSPQGSGNPPGSPRHPHRPPRPQPPPPPPPSKSKERIWESTDL